MNPNEMSRKIVEMITSNEFIRMKLHTTICHELTSKQIKELYLETKFIFENSNQTKLF